MADKDNRSGRMAFEVANLNAAQRVKSFAGAVAVSDRIRSGGSDRPAQDAALKTPAPKALAK
jgi:hypothetical protein